MTPAMRYLSCCMPISWFVQSEVDGLGVFHAFTFASTPRMPEGFTIMTMINNTKA